LVRGKSCKSGGRRVVRMPGTDRVFIRERVVREESTGKEKFPSNHEINKKLRIPRAVGLASEGRLEHPCQVR
jgi:hypothetical protein